MSSTPCPQPANCDFEEVDDKFEFCSWANVNREIAPVVKNQPKLNLKAPFDNRTIALKCKGNNKYWCAESGGVSYVTADRGELWAWELFKIVSNDDNTVSIISLTNDKYTYIGSINSYMYFTNTLDASSKYELIANSDGSYSFKNILTDKYVSARNIPGIDYFLLCANKGKLLCFQVLT